MMAKRGFVYDAEADGYRCPQGQLLAYATTDRTGYRHYRVRSGALPDLPAARLLHDERQGGPD